MIKINYSALVLTLAHYKSTQVVFSPEYRITFTACISYLFYFIMSLMQSPWLKLVTKS